MDPTVCLELKTLSLPLSKKAGGVLLKRRHDSEDLPYYHILQPGVGPHSFCYLTSLNLRGTVNATINDIFQRGHRKSETEAPAPLASEVLLAIQHLKTTGEGFLPESELSTIVEATTKECLTTIVYWQRSYDEHNYSKHMRGVYVHPISMDIALLAYKQYIKARLAVHARRKAILKLDKRGNIWATGKPQLVVFERYSETGKLQPSVFDWWSNPGKLQLLLDWWSQRAEERVILHFRRLDTKALITATFTWDELDHLSERGIIFADLTWIDRHSDSSALTWVDGLNGSPPPPPFEGFGNYIDDLPEEIEDLERLPPTLGG